MTPVKELSRDKLKLGPGSLLASVSDDANRKVEREREGV